MAYIPEDARWYIADLVLEHHVTGDTRNLVHVNIHLIEAGSPDEAYEKAMTLGKESELAYTNADGKEVRSVFRGLRDLNVIHDKLEDGAELAYEESVDVPEAELASSLSAKEDLGVFRKRQAKPELMQFASGDIIKQLKDAGFTPGQLAGEA